MGGLAQDGSMCSNVPHQAAHWFWLFSGKGEVLVVFGFLSVLALFIYTRQGLGERRKRRVDPLKERDVIFFYMGKVHGNPLYFDSGGSRGNSEHREGCC